jgi:hypothetical protein
LLCPLISYEFVGRAPLAPDTVVAVLSIIIDFRREVDQN